VHVLILVGKTFTAKIDDADLRLVSSLLMANRAASQHDLRASLCEARGWKPRHHLQAPTYWVVSLLEGCRTITTGTTSRTAGREKRQAG